MTFQFPTLPKPDILDETAYEAILKRKLDLFRAKRPDYTNLVEGDLVYVMAEVAAYDELNMRKQMNNTYLQTLILFASGTNLDNLVANIGLTRQVKKKAVFDDNGVLIEPEVLETDDQLRQRYIISWHALGLGTFGWYKFHALNADVQVKDAFPKRTGDGQVTVYIQSEGANGGVPDAALLKTVTDYMEVLRRRTLCDTLVIAGITTVSYEIEAEIEVPHELNKDAVLAKVQAEAEAFAADNEVIDRDIPISKFYAVLSPEGVEGVTLSKPTANVTTTNSQVPIASSVTITVA